MRIIALVVLVCLAWSPLVAAQDLAAELQNRAVANLDGTIGGADLENIYAKDAGQAPYVVWLVPKISKVEVTGKAKRDYLRPGMAIRFSAATLDKRGNAKGELTDLAIFTPEQGHEPQVLAEGEKGPYLVVGGITNAAKNGKVTINAGTQKVTAQFPEDAEIQVMLNDHNVVREGDKIKVTGRLWKMPMAEGEPTVIAAETVTVELVEPLSGAKKKPVKKTPPPKKSAKKAAS